jgi:hypothetical protein
VLKINMTENDKSNISIGDTVFNDPQGSSLEILSESLLRISLAGLGGALVGLSFKRHSRRHNLFSSSFSSPYENAPYTFAIRFTAFAGILEFHRLLSPTQRLLSWLYHTSPPSLATTITHVSDIPLQTPQLQDNKPKDVVYRSWIPSKAAITIFDYTMGGFVAGAIFSRLPHTNPPPIQSAVPKAIHNEAILAKQKKLMGKGRRLTLPSSHNTPPIISTLPVSTTPSVIVSMEGSTHVIKNSFHFRQAIVRGALPGLVLGFMAGLLQYSLDELVLSIQEMEKDEKKKEMLLHSDAINKVQGIEESINVKDMTIDELKRAIEILKSRKT